MMAKSNDQAEVANPPSPERKSYQSGPPLLRVRDLTKHFLARSAVGRPNTIVRAVDGVDLDVHRGETVALVGESGCGKTTVARLILGLLEPTSGTIELDGVDIVGPRGSVRRDVSRRIQMVFQDPAGSLNPRLRIRDSIAEPLRATGEWTKSEIADRVAELLSLVGLQPSMGRRFPHEFSGGQRQRIGIARAIAIRPDLVVADEPTSALDVSIRVQILNLLSDLQAKLGTSFLLVSHDLAVVRHYSHRVSVMFAGKIVEEGPTPQVLFSPSHPYTRQLLASVPTLTPANRRVLSPFIRDCPDRVACD